MMTGECKQSMTKYLSCIKKVKGVNEGECRELAKAYLSCRMDRNLMAKDDFKNLGFQNPTEDAGSSSSKTANDNNTQAQVKPA